MCMLACIHPGHGYEGETNAVLDYARTTASIVRQVTRAEVKDTRTFEEKSEDTKGVGENDPMEGDEFDHDDDLMRRTEYIETQAHGLLHARMIGDAEQPLILYLHSSKVRM